MEKLQNEVVLFGHWVSNFTHRVELALKLKGVPYEYVYNPVRKKVPVLVHNGKPIADSLVILEYIDDQWNYSPRLLPEDPFQRAKIRFWANFCDQKVPLLTKLGLRCAGYITSVPPRRFEPRKSRKGANPLDHQAKPLGGNYQDFEEPLLLDFNLRKHQASLSWITALQGNHLVKKTLPRYKLIDKIRDKFPQAPTV